jgi:hypothetical protein
MLDRSIDSGIHSRNHVLHFSAPPDAAVKRIDPVALQPQDFVDEWLTHPWSEMESRTAEDEKVKKWHEVLSGDLVFGDFTLVQKCQDLPEQWQIAVDLNWLAGRELPEPLTVFFLVQQLEQYRFKMTGISFERQEGCPGDGQANEDRPSLFAATSAKP